MAPRIDAARLFKAQREIGLFRMIMFVIMFILAMYTYFAFGYTRVSDKIYYQLQSNHYCNRRLNATHQVGCTSKLGGNHGILWMAKNDKDIKHILDEGTTPPYIVILGHNQYSLDNLLKFNSSLHRVAGVIFRNDNPSAPPIPFSPDYLSPNQYHGLYANQTAHSWQDKSQISGLLYQDIRYPIFFMNDVDSIKKLDECFTKNHYIKDDQTYQRNYPLCGVHLDSFMLAASNSENCLNSISFVDQLLQTNGRRCINVENQNIFSYYLTAEADPVEDSDKYYTPGILDKQSVVMLVAKLSSVSMFTDISPGADSTITSIVTLLAIAQALGDPKYRKDKKIKDSKRNIAFALFDSEPFDYIGSTYVVNMMKNNQFPNRRLMLKSIQRSIANINLKSLDYVINFDQLAPHKFENQLYLHIEPSQKDSSRFTNLKNILIEHAEETKLDLKLVQELPLPPTSVHQFIKESIDQKEDNRLIGAVLSNYRDKYTNPFYHSIHDNALEVGLSLSSDRLIDHITKVSTTIARATYQLAFGVKENQINVDRSLVSQLLHCYLTDANCTEFLIALPEGQAPPTGPVQTFKDPVKRSDDMNGFLTANLLSYYLGDQNPGLNQSECRQLNRENLIYNFHYANGPNHDKPGICVQSQMLSQGFDSLAYKQGSDAYVTVDKRYPAWTASYDGIRNPVRMFMVPSPLYGWCLLIAGSLITFISFLTLCWVQNFIAKLELVSRNPTST